MIKNIHFIGIAGSAIAPIAILMKSLGHNVSGSDEHIFEPALSLLTKYEIDWNEGYDRSRVQNADLVIIGGGPLIKNQDNEEFLEAKRLGKQIEGYAYLLKEFVVKENSIVVTGSYGKTTTSAMINWILETAGLNPSFMIGGKPINFDTGVRATDGIYSCLEGDEFVATFGFDMEPRFTHYKPKFTIVSSVKWDHIDVYPTEQSYIDAYIKLVKLVEENEGKLFLCASGENNEKLLTQYNGKLITYMLAEKESRLDQKVNYLAYDIVNDDIYTKFKVSFNGTEIGQFETEMIGDHNIENALASISMAHDLGIDLELIAEGVKTFRGIKRRQEIKGKTKSGAIVIDDFAHSPIKAESTLKAIKSRYPSKKILAIYFPRLSAGEDRRTLDWYTDTFVLADYVLIPKIIVKKSTPKEQRIYGKEYVDAINRSKQNAYYMPKDSDLTDFILKNSDQNSVILFMSASDWRGIIEELIQ